MNKLELSIDDMKTQSIQHLTITSSDDRSLSFRTVYCPRDNRWRICIVESGEGSTVPQSFLSLRDALSFVPTLLGF